MGSNNNNKLALYNNNNNNGATVTPLEGCWSGPATYNMNLIM